MTGFNGILPCTWSDLACAEEKSHFFLMIELMHEDCMVLQIGKPFDIEGII
jgi:hypothetical protein